MYKRTFLTLVASAIILGCDDGGTPASGPLGTDAKVLEHINTTDPHGAYTLFPHADSVTSGTLNGSTAHQPMVRVSMNDKAIASLVDGRFPSGGSFQEGSVILKEIREGGVTTVWAVIVKAPDNQNASAGWLWAEYTPGGGTVYSITNKGAGCVGCHSLDQGPAHDHVRTFERQTP